MDRLPVIRRDPVTDQDVVVPDLPDVELRRAKGLDQRIRLLVGAINDSVDKLHKLVDQARDTESYRVLGYPTLADYLANVFVIPARLDRGTRADVVGFLSDHVGMSQRQIGGVIGVDHKTVGNDLRDRRGGGENSPPDAVGQHQVLDEAQHDADSVTITAPKPPRKPLPDAARELSLDMAKIIRRADKMLDDDRFGQHRDAIGCQVRPHVEIGLKTLQRFDAEINPRGPHDVLPMIVQSLEAITVACHSGRPDTAVGDAERVQYIATIRDYLDAIHDAVDIWEATRDRS